MAVEWRQVRIGDVAEVFDGPHATPKKTPSGPIFLGINALEHGRLNLSDVEHLSEEDFVTWTRRILPRAGDVVFSYETRLGEAAMIPEGLRCCLGRRMGLVRARDGKLDPRFFLYQYLSPSFQAFLESRSVYGSTVDRIPLIDFPDFPIALPPIDEQRAIAHVLGTLDDKINLNRRMNETLEAIARAIFKCWFIDFDPVRAKANGEPPESICRRLHLTPDLLALFPDRFQDSELGEIPDGWNTSSIEKVSMKVGMGPFGSNIKVATFVPEGVPVISGQHLNDTMLEDNTFNFISKEHAEKLTSANVIRGDIVFTHAGNIGQVAYIPDRSRYHRYVLSQRQFFMRCDISRISPIFMTYFFRSPEGQHKLLANTTQVGVPSIARPVSYLKSIELVVPPKLLVDQFDSLVRTFHQRISTGRSEIESLTKLRDALLPKLISGELRIPEAAANERS